MSDVARSIATATRSTRRIWKWSAAAATGRLSASRIVDDDPRRVGQQRAAPAPGTKRRERRQRHQRRAEGQDRPIGRKVVGGRTGRRGHQHAVGDQFPEPRRPIDLDAELRRLIGLAQERHFVDRARDRLGPINVARAHGERMNDRGPGGGEPSRARPSPPHCAGRSHIRALRHAKSAHGLLRIRARRGRSCWRRARASAA